MTRTCYWSNTGIQECMCLLWTVSLVTDNHTSFHVCWLGQKSKWKHKCNDCSLSCKQLTTADHHVEETRVILVVLAVNVSSLQGMLYLFLWIQAAVSQAMLVSLFVKGHDKDVAWLKVGVLQRQHTLKWGTFLFYSACGEFFSFIQPVGNFSLFCFSMWGTFLFYSACGELVCFIQRVCLLQLCSLPLSHSKLTLNYQLLLQLPFRPA